MKTIIFFLAFTVYLLGTSIAGGCQTKDNKTTFIDNAQATNVQPVDHNFVNVSVMKVRKLPDSIDRYKEESKAKISKLDKDIAVLKEKIANGTDATKAEYKKDLADLEQKSMVLKSKLDKFNDKEAVKWHAFKKEMNHDMDELGKAISDLGKKNTK